LQDPVCVNRKIAVRFKGTRIGDSSWYAGELEGKTGYVQSVLPSSFGFGATANVLLDVPLPEGASNFPPIKYLSPVEPEQGDLALVLDGQYKGRQGIVDQRDDSGHCVLRSEAAFFDADVDQLVKLQPE